MSQSVTAIVPRARQIVRRDPVLAIAAVLAVASCALVPPDAGYAGYVDFRTLGLLFSLMTVMAGLTRAGVFTAAGRALLARTHSGTGAIMALVLLPFVASMLVTNDVSLIAFVPFALLVLRMLGLGGTSVFTVVMMTIAANLGSMLTPIGNPQNLYLFSASGMGVGEFLLLMLPYAAVSGGLLVASVLLYGARHRGLPLSDAAGEKDLAPQEARIRRRALAPWAALFALSLLAVVRVVPVALLVPVVAIAALIIDRGALAEVDFGLLLTFVVFFVFVGNVGRMGAVNDLLATLVGGNELAVSVAASQVVSNVPAALLLSGFTSAWPALIVGTNLGGLGTLIASMASLISYKQVVESEPDAAGRYLVRFTIANVAFLAALALLALLLF